MDLTTFSDTVRDLFEGTKIKVVEERIADWLRRGGDRIKAAQVAADRHRQREQQYLIQISSILLHDIIE